MWKAFDEMEEMGWIGSLRPRMISVQAEGCAPIVRAFHAGRAEAEPVTNAHTVASGLRVPSTIADFIMLRILRESGGTAVSVSDAQLIEGALRLGTAEGIFAAPEAGACVAALDALLEKQMIDRNERVVVFNTGTGLKYVKSNA